VNFGTPVPLLIGIILILFSVFLFFLEKFKPGYKRDSDVIYASLALAAGILNLVDLSGGFLHSAQAVIFTGVFIALSLEVINARTPENSPKPMGMGPRDDDRAPRSYRAGFEDNFGAMDDRGNARRQMRDGRDEYDSRRGSRNERDRFLEDRPQRRSSRDEPLDRGGMDRGSPRRSRDSFGDDPPVPRSIPERTSASDDRPRNAPPSRDEFEDVPRPRRRPEPGTDRDESRRNNRSSVEPPASDYVEFRPVEPIPPKESWGPKE
jgi:Ycf66 protein N-terminus